MKKPCVALLVLALIVIGLGLSPGPGLATAQAEEDKLDNIRFLWAFGAMAKGGNGQKPILITRDTTLKSGDQIKFFVKLKDTCFVYVIYHSSQGELSTLFPFRFEPQSTRGRTLEKHYIPQGDMWFELDDNPGQERFYLLASTQRLEGLETLINRYEATDPTRKAEVATKILAEIKKLRRRHRKFRTYAERPVNILGHLRGADKVKKPGHPDIAKFAVEISAKDFYSRTFTIDHR
jgi:hypothetical protein